MRGNAGSGMRGRECGECGGMRGRGMRRECGVSLNLVNFLSRIMWLRHTQKHYATTEALRVARCAVPHHPAGRRPSRDFFKRHGSADVSRRRSPRSRGRKRGRKRGPKKGSAWECVQDRINTKYLRMKSISVK